MAKKTKVVIRKGDQLVAMCHVPAYGNALITIAVSDDRKSAFNHMKRAFHYDNWKDLTEDEAMGGWTLELDEGQFFVWIGHPRVSPPGSFSFENVAVHELTHVLRALLMYTHTTLVEANEPSAYLMGWLMEACCAIRDLDIAWLDKEGFVVKQIPRVPN